MDQVSILIFKEAKRISNNLINICNFSIDIIEKLNSKNIINKKSYITELKKLRDSMHDAENFIKIIDDFLSQ